MLNQDNIYCDITFKHSKLDCAIKHLTLLSHINQPFTLTLTLSCPKPLKFFQQNLHQNFLLKISSQSQPTYYCNGLLTKIQSLNKDIHGDYLYELTINPAITLYADTAYQYLFNGLSVIDIAKQILTTRPLTTAPITPQDYLIKIKNSYPPLYRILVRDESFLTFFQRILSYQGLNYFFDHSTPLSPLVLTDTLNDIATTTATPFTPNSPEALSLAPYIETIHYHNNNNLPQKVLSTGAPRLEPHILFAEANTVLNSNITTLYHLNTNEQLDNNAKTRAHIASLAHQSEQTTASLIGGGLLFAGTQLDLQNDELSTWLIRKSHIEITFDEHDQYRLGSINTKIFAQDANIPYQAHPQFGEHSSLLSGINIGTPSTDQGNNLISVNEQGHYHANLPLNFNSNNEAQGVQIFDTRMVQPMHSNDHSSHMTLPSNSEGILLWSEGFSGEPLLLGTLNNLDNTHPTTKANPQNAYWQDNDTNKLGFVNEGNFIPYQKTGRNTASIIETPSYDPNNNQSYLRLGDPIANDQHYPAQAAEPGLFLTTSGNYQEQHQGGVVTIAGNLNQDSQSDGFTPTLRHMVQLAPTLGTYHILETSTAHVHNTLLSSDNVNETHNQDANTIHKTLSAQQNLQTYNADTITNIYVNQNHQTQGDYTSATYNNHMLTAQSSSTTILESGQQTTETHDTHTLNLNHLNNQFTSQTLQSNITSQTTSITQLTQNFTHYTGQANTLNANSQTTQITANNTSIGGNTFQQGGILSINNSSATPNIPDIQNINQQGINAIQDEQAPQKKEIVFLLDCPDNPPALQLCVNNINPITITPNTEFIYPLTDKQKKGSINLINQIQENQIQNTLHPDIRKINLQYNCPPEAQMPEAYFNQQGQLPIYQGIIDLSDCGMPNNLVDQAYSLICFDTNTMPSNIKLGKTNLSTWTTEAINWLTQQLEQSVGNINTWIINSSGVDADATYDNISFALNKDNRDILKGFIKTGILKTTQVDNKLIISFAHTEKFKAYINFFISTGGSVAAMAGQVEISKEIYFTRKGIQLIRLAKTFATMTPSEKTNFNEKLNNYKSLSSKDVITDFIIINIFDLAKKNLTNESLLDYLTDVTLDNANNLATILMTIFTDGIATLLFNRKEATLVISKVFGQFFVVGYASNKLTEQEQAINLHEKIANSQIVKNAANFMSNFYNNNLQSKYTQYIFKKLALMIQNGLAPT